VGKRQVELGRTGTAEEIAEHLAFLAAGLGHGEVSLESPDGVLRLTPGATLTLEIDVRQKTSKGRIGLTISWRRPRHARVSELKVAVGTEPSA
jgi:amphi-Trp domain-containing protein